MLRIVGATLVIALVGSRWLNTRCLMGDHKGRPYTYSIRPRCVTSGAKDKLDESQTKTAPSVLLRLICTTHLH